MKIVIVSREYRGVTSYSGGIGTFYALFGPRLVARGHEVTLVTVSREPSHTWHVSGVEVRGVRNRLPEWLWFLDDAAAAIASDRALSRLGRPDVILAAEWGGDAALYARRRNRPPLVTQLTTSLEQIRILGNEQPSRRLAFKYWIQSRLERFQAGRSDGIIACSRAIMEWTTRLWRLTVHPRAVIGNFTDVEQVREAARSPLPDGFPVDGRTVVFAGRLEPRKGVHVLVQAMQPIWSELPDVELVLMGQDHRWGARTMSDHLAELAGPYRSRLHWLGEVPAAQVFSAFGAAEVVVFPSLWENFSLATLEARAQGAPVIVTSGSGFDDFVQDQIDGIVVPPDDHVALGSEIRRLLNSQSLRRELGSRAAEAETRRAENVIRDFETFFRSVTESATGRPSSD